MFSTIPASPYPQPRYSRPIVVTVMLALLLSLTSAEAAWAVTWATPEELMESVDTPDPTPKVAVEELTSSPAPMPGRRPDPGTTDAYWPQRASGLTGVKQASVGGLGVTVTGLAGATEVQVADQEGSRRAGVQGVVFGLTRQPDGPVTRDGEGQDDAAAQAAAVTVSVDVSAFADAIGGDWASRARLVWLPGCNAASVGTGCAQTTQQLLDGASDGTTVSGVLPTAATSRMSAGMTTLALMAGPTGGAGSFTATSLSPSSAWSAGSGTGEFSWQYPVEVPDAQAGPAPEVTISYSSAAVDGRTASTNNQASWVGDGFNLDLGYVERRYVGCSDDTAAVGGVTPNNTNRKTGDLCWGPDSVTLSLDGRTTDLVHDTTTGSWVPKDDDSSRVQLLTGAAGNGDDNGEYWLVTTDDGTKYYFGVQTVERRCW